MSSTIFWPLSGSLWTTWFLVGLASLWNILLVNIFCGCGWNGPLILYILCSLTWVGSNLYDLFFLLWIHFMWNQNHLDPWRWFYVLYRSKRSLPFPYSNQFKPVSNYVMLIVTRLNMDLVKYQQFPSGRFAPWSWIVLKLYCRIQLLVLNL